MIEELKKLRLCQGLGDDRLEQLAEHAKFQIIEKEQVIAKEGEAAKHFFVLIKGDVEVSKHVEYSPDGDHVIAKLNPGELIGEMALLEDKPRSATITAKKASVLIKFNIKEIRDDISLLSLLSKNIATDLSSRLRHTNQVTVKSLEDKLVEAKARVGLGLFMIAILWFMALYSLSLSLLSHYQKDISNGALISSTILIILSCALFTTMIKGHYSLKRFGLTFDNCKQDILEALILSLPVLFACLAIKAIYLASIGQTSITALISPKDLFTSKTGFNPQLYVMSGLAYLLLVPIQEFIARGAMQSTFMQLLPEHNRVSKWHAIILANVIFAMAHAHTNLAFAIGSFILGLFWGWLYQRQQSLFGVIASHLFVGGFILFAMGLPSEILLFPHINAG